MVVAVFDLYYLLVETVFGSVFLSILGLSALYLVLGMFTRMSVQTIILTIGLFIMTISIGFIGGAAAFLFGIIALTYFFQGLINYILTMRT